ncbi:MAG: tRNA lysidine(34) synthetase TilS [Saprospiraceae bacterium]|nr:tRNA lysidine(34) synthetase TilS [Saprospiraceae bacterium]
MQERLLEYIRRLHLPLPDNRPVLLAVSGGLDSVCLAHLWSALQWPAVIAHANFQLRGEESDGDEKFVCRLATQLDMPVRVNRFDTLSFAEQHGISIQMAARQLRYSWFESLVEKEQLGAIVTAHHRNDAVETLLMNLARGTGLKGLGGIRPRQGNLLRPLLFAIRAELEEYAAEQGLEWREDSSNDKDDYVRNAVRQHLIPRFEQLNPQFLSTAVRNMERFQAAADNLEFLLHQWLGMRNGDTLVVDKTRLTALPSPEEALRILLKPHGFTAEQARQIAELLSDTGQEWQGSSGLRLLNDREALLLTPNRALPQAIRIEADDLLRKLPDNSSIVLTPASPSPPYPDGRRTTLVDSDRLRFPLLLRPWQPGDSFQPIGMGGQHQKIQDYFTNQKASRLDKEKTWVLTDADGQIIWLLGWRPDERFKITPVTQNALKISWLQDLP